MGEAEAAALFTALGPAVIADLVKNSGPEFAPQMFLEMGAEFSGG
jgi:hypothetical protein